MSVPVIVRLRWSDVLELVDRAALWAALDGPVAGGGEPDGDVRVCWAAGAADVLFVTEALNYDGVVEGACMLFCKRVALVWGVYIWRRTQAAGIQRPHVEDVYALHLSENLQALETCGLFEIGGDGSGWSAGREEVVLVLDLCVLVLAMACSCASFSI